ncbi:LOW QUALITY PROTEIN: hypothetical protein ACJ73_06264 [Blastomyces percursus]|uniref:Protein kinase domain-containing protein n=1 Tax=Blastomyces percursus TaxID=1658174 RepID=A0A1J9Q2R9_9EURO|nr:LOW QUALITY PROTEIN: hypothetical protein ACJ73_06264 [Blastomyces percursus]
MSSNDQEFSLPLKAEERPQVYRPGGFHPVHLGEVYDRKYKVLRKLGFGRYSTGLFKVKGAQLDIAGARHSRLRKYTKPNLATCKRYDPVIGWRKEVLLKCLDLFSVIVATLDFDLVIVLLVISSRPRGDQTV